MKRKFEESLLLTYPLIFVGGFFDAYSYLIRGKTFATMQTGNMILLVYNMVLKNFKASAMYLIPIFAFFIGSMLAQIIETKLEKIKRISWHAIILIIEIILIIPIIFIKEGEYNFIANMLLSFASGIQLHSFRRANGLTLATTMCTGNLKSSGENLGLFIVKKDKQFLFNFLTFISLIIIFMLGCLTSFILTKEINHYAIFITLIPLILVLIMFIVFNRRVKE